MTRPRCIVLVGHCSPDVSMLRSALRSFVSGVEVRVAGSQADLDHLLPESDLLLVNRILDGSFEADGGLDLMRSMSGRAVSTRWMLVSNFEEAQAEAESLGAFPGFGKSGVRSDETRRRIVAALEGQRA